MTHNQQSKQQRQSDEGHAGAVTGGYMVCCSLQQQNDVQVVNIDKYTPVNTRLQREQSSKLILLACWAWATSRGPQEGFSNCTVINNIHTPMRCAAIGCQRWFRSMSMKSLEKRDPYPFTSVNESFCNFVLLALSTVDHKDVECVYRILGYQIVRHQSLCTTVVTAGSTNSARTLRKPAGQMLIGLL